MLLNNLTALFIGPYITAAAAVYTDRPVLQPLATVHLHFHPTHNTARLDLERFVPAIRTTSNALKEMYSGMTAATIPRSPSVFWPYKTSYTDFDSKVRTFTYKVFKDNFVYSATAGNKEKIVVKFVKPDRYSEHATEVHQYAAAQGFAPSLLAAEKLPAGWVMVVMPNLEVKPAYHQFVNSRDSTETIRKAINGAVQSLHAVNHVHGDLRADNTLVKEDGSSIQVIDWDWSGIAGTATYPTNVNNTSMWRPDGVNGGNYIAPERDLQMVEYLFGATS